MPEQLSELWANLRLTYFDGAVIVVLLLSTLVALVRGLVREVVGLASWVGAFVVAWYAFAHVRPLVREAMGNELLADLATGAGVFLVPLIVFKILGGILAGGIDGAGLGGLDRIGGVIFGLARGALLVCVAWLVVGFLVKPEQLPQWVREAYVLPQVQQGSDWLRGFLPAELEAQGRAASAGALEKARELEAVGDLLSTPRNAEPQAPAYSDEQRQQMDQLVQPTQPGN
jgi:membrane protein required for colicin V production